MGNRVKLILFLTLGALIFSTPAKAQSSYKKVARYIVKSAVDQGKTRVAVLTYTPLGGEATGDGEIISEEIIVEIVGQGKLSVVERSQVEKILKELEFSQTGAIDARTAKKIGNGLGADALVIGSYTRINEREIKLFTKLVDTETFQVLGASQDIIAGISRKDKDAKLDDPDLLVNRRVLILDFVNINDSPDYGYLEKSIPESFLEDLDKTRKFELMERSIWVDAVKSNAYEKKDADNEKIALQVGRKYAADVVLIGSFVVVGNEMKIFAKAIELSSQRVMVSRSVTSPLNNTIFNRIRNLTNDMSSQMAEKLPPLPQRVIVVERKKYGGSNPFLVDDMTYGGMIWRTAVMPGWGHLYADQWRGWIYMPLWAGSLGTFVIGAIDTAIKEEAYNSATSGLEAAYADYRDARLVRNIAFVSLLGVYAVTLADILIFGKSYEQKPAISGALRTDFYAIILPMGSPDNSQRKGDFYVQIGAQAKF